MINFSAMSLILQHYTHLRLCTMYIRIIGQLKWTNHFNMDIVTIMLQETI